MYVKCFAVFFYSIFFFQNLKFKKLTNINLTIGSCCGLVGRAVTSKSRGSQFVSSHWQHFILKIYCQLYWKDENKEKEAGHGPFLNKTLIWQMTFQIKRDHERRGRERATGSTSPKAKQLGSDAKNRGHRFESLRGRRGPGNEDSDRIRGGAIYRWSADLESNRRETGSEEINDWPNRRQQIQKLQDLCRVQDLVQVGPLARDGADRA